MLCTSHLLILRDSDIIPASLLHPVALDIITAHADLEHDSIIYLDTDKLWSLSDTYFSTSAGPDLCFLRENAKHYQVDWVRISTKPGQIRPTN